MTFSFASPGTYNAAADTYSGPATTTVAGYAVRDEGDPERYRALSLSLTEAPTLLFAPSTAGSVPALGSTVTWGGVSYTVKDVDPIAPAGTAIVSKVIVAR